MISDFPDLYEYRDKKIERQAATIRLLREDGERMQKAIKKQVIFMMK